MELVKSLTNFIKNNVLTDKPLLLALSGGSDSLALFYMLLETGFPFAVAHVNHNWRAASTAEAEQLETLAAKHQVSFHLLTLNPNELQGNLEHACREERLHFFKKLIHTHQYQAVILGHHANDQAETVLKKFFESSSNLASLRGIEQITMWNGIALWRPLLPFTKAEIVTWLNEQGHEGFEDETNFDTRFTRARLRQNLLPMLNETFGKDVQRPLERIAQEASQLNAFMSDLLESTCNRIQQGCFGWYVSKKEIPTFQIYPYIYVLRSLAKAANATFSNPQLQQAAEYWIKGYSNKKFIIKDFSLIIDRDYAFILKNSAQSSSSINLIEGINIWGNWIIHFAPKNNTKILTGWQNVWKGEIILTVPHGNYQIQPGQNSQYFPSQKKTLGKWWTDSKIPAFLRSQTPVICQNQQVIAECLGKSTIQGEWCLHFKYNTNVEAEKAI